MHGKSICKYFFANSKYIYAQQASRDILTNIDMSKLCIEWAPGADCQLGKLPALFIAYSRVPIRRHGMFIRHTPFIRPNTFSKK